MADETSSVSIETAKGKFYHARNLAVRDDIMAHLRGSQDDLLPYDAVSQVLRAYRQGMRSELRPIPLNRIVGSVGRYHDFTRRFLPRPAVDVERWSAIDIAMETMEGVPAIEVYQIGSVYFVLDGNHRVSVARANRLSTIDAYVTIIDPEVAVDLEPGDTLDAVIVKAEFARFAAETGLCADTAARDIVCSRPGGYPELLDHVAVHAYFITLDHPEAAEPSLQAAAADWYTQVYQPIVKAIGARGLPACFPGMTAADIYVWVSARILEHHAQSGEQLSAEAAAAQVAQEPPIRPAMLAAVLSTMNRATGKAIEMITPEGEYGPASPGKVLATPIGKMPSSIIGILRGDIQGGAV